MAKLSNTMSKHMKLRLIEKQTVRRLMKLNLLKKNSFILLERLVYLENIEIENIVF